MPPLVVPQVLVAASAQHGGLSMIPRPGGIAGAEHITVPHGMGAIAPVPAAAEVPAKPAVPPPKPAVPTGAGVVPSSPPHPNTLTKPASATAVHHALFIAGNPLRLHRRAGAPGEQLRITKCDISVHGICSKPLRDETRGIEVLSFRSTAVQFRSVRFQILRELQHYAGFPECMN